MKDDLSGEVTVARLKALPEYRLWLQSVQDASCGECSRHNRKSELVVVREPSFSEAIAEQRLSTLGEVRACAKLWDLSYASVLCEVCFEERACASRLAWAKPYKEEFLRACMGFSEQLYQFGGRNEDEAE